MQPMPHFKANAKLDALISDLRWRVQLLDADIEEEERKSRVFNPANPSYSRLAVTMRERRDNLQTTVAALQKQLETLMSVTNERGRLSDPLPVKIFVRDEMPARRHSRYRRPGTGAIRDNYRA